MTHIWRSEWGVLSGAIRPFSSPSCLHFIFFLALFVILSSLFILFSRVSLNRLKIP